MRKGSLYVCCVFAAAMLSGCAATHTLPNASYRLVRNKIEVENKELNSSELQAYISQKAGTPGFFGWSPAAAWYYRTADSKGFFGKLLHKMLREPVIYDPAQVDASIDNMHNHLNYLGYYGSSIKSEVQVRRQEVSIVYHVKPGKRYPIREIHYDLPDEEAFRQDFEADRSRITIQPGMHLSASSLEAESERSAQYFRTKGYYGFSKTQYFFEADTLSHTGLADLTYAIREYGRNDSPQQAAALHKYQLGDIRMQYDSKLPLRPSVLENLNMLRPGDLYDESAVNRTYARLSALNVFSGVSISMNQRDSALVDCDIRLQHSRLQGFKLNLEASTNSTGLIGISPQLTYFHKNIFHGGERLNVGLKGNFQFQPNSSVRSTEFTFSSGIGFPSLLGLPNRLFTGNNIPRTDVSAAFNYQNRPEFTRTTISASYGYSGSIGQRFFFQFFPIQTSIVRMFDVDPTFSEYTRHDPFLENAYESHFDAGMGSMLYYTTDNSLNPRGSYRYGRLSLGLSGNALSLLNPSLQQGDDGEHLIWGTPYSQYVRTELQLGWTLSLGGRCSLATRLVGGIGVPYGNSDALPFDQAFYAGGANSMRGWQARTVGPGGAQMNEYFIIPNQTGDLKLETDLEFRYPLFWKFEGALFAEAGNVWSLFGSVADGSGIHTFPKTLAGDWGLGLRLDFDIILVRLDLGMRVHDPALAEGSRWIRPAQWLTRGNYAVHFGVGYPF